MNTLKQKIKKIITSIQEILKFFYFQKYIPLKSKILQEGNKEYSNSDKKFLFLFVSWASFFLFLFVFFLSGKNPLKLLIPFSLYDLPASEKLVQGKVYVSDGEGNIFEINRKMDLKTDDLNRNLITLVGEIGEPPFYEKSSGNEAAFNANLKKLPNLQTSVISTWYLKNEKKLIMDLRQTSISDELESLKFRIDNPALEEEREDSDEGHFSTKKANIDPQKRKSEIKKIRLTILKSTFLAIEKTIFANFSQIDSLEFRLDGYRKDYPELEYSFLQRKIRN